MELRELVERGVILRATVGSTVHGLHHGGQDDRDEMAVFVEPPEYRLGLKLAPGAGAEAPPARALGRADAARGCPVRAGRPRSRRVQPAQVRPAGAEGPPDRAAAPVRPPELTPRRDRPGHASCAALTDAILSKRAGRGYRGYLGGQRERLLGSRGQKRVNRPELVEAHGYDTKYAMHAIRLGYQGIELLETGRAHAADAGAGALARDGRSASASARSTRSSPRSTRSRRASRPRSSPPPCRSEPDRAAVDALPRRRLPPRLGLAVTKRAPAEGGAGAPRNVQKAGVRHQYKSVSELTEKTRKSAGCGGRKGGVRHRYGSVTALAGGDRYDQAAGAVRLPLPP